MRWQSYLTSRTPALNGAAAEGNFVFIAAKGSCEGAPRAYIDLYRVEADKLVED
jgi:hypothetical protein